ncbi:MAG TPA: sugar phosphate isomerase/epimerase family protein [Coriobacteriia bacterium]|nr:sugar phosphate isomerase/epimerase family protein [Coriobacteriia bacterium]
MIHIKYAARVNSFVAVHGDVEASLREIAKTESIRYVDLNYPEHFADMSVAEMKSLLAQIGLTVNSVAMRFSKDFVHGEYTNRDEAIRRAGIELTKQGMDLTAELGADLVTVWLGYDGFDNTFQKDYSVGLDLAIAAFRELADYRPDIRLSIEYKPYEERVQSLIPNVGTTLYVLEKIGRDNVGATLDFAHMLMAGDAPGYGASLLASKGKLWGVHLNDGNNAHDDGLMVASIHTWETLEFLYYLLRYNYEGVIYFDTFPSREDPREEAVTNAETVDLLIAMLTSFGIDRITELVSKSDGIQAQLFRNSLLRRSQECA